MEEFPYNTVEYLSIEPFQEAYNLLDAKTPGQLSLKYTEEDQKLMKDHTWDYSNPELITNKIKDILETIDENQLTETQKEHRDEILWFWYHHAISCAIWRHKDKQKAEEYAKKALFYQDKDHPNKITRLLYLLIQGNISEAEKWAQTITKEPEKSTASELIKEYKQNPYFR